MVRTTVFKVRLSAEEWKKLKQYSSTKQISCAEVVRDFIKSLPLTK